MPATGSACASRPARIGNVRPALGRWNLKREEYADAVGPLHDYLLAEPDSADAAKCRGQLTSAFIGAKRFSEAGVAFDEFALQHPQDKSLPAITLQLADA